MAFGAVLKNLSKAIPGSLRLALFLMVLVIGALGYFGLKSILSSGEDVASNKNQNPSRLSDAPSQLIEKESAVSETIVPEGSATERAMQEVAERKVQKAIEEGNRTVLSGVRLKATDLNGNDDTAAEPESPSSGGLMNASKVRDQIDPDAAFRERLRRITNQNNTEISQAEQNNSSKKKQALLETQRRRAEAERFRLYQEIRARQQDGLEKELKALKAEAVAGLDSAYNRAMANADRNRSVEIVLFQVADKDRRGSKSEQSSGSVSETGNYFDAFVDTEIEPFDPSVIDSTRAQAQQLAGGEGHPAGGGQQLAAESQYPRDRLAAAYHEDKGTYISIGDFFYATLYNTANSDKPGYIWAKIVSPGPLQGAILRGMPELVDEESLKIAFNVMSINGRDIQVSAVAVNPDDFSTFMADDVDRHLIERYGKLFAATFLQGYVDFLSDRSVRVTEDGTVITEHSSIPDAKDRALAGLAKFGETILPQWEEDFNKPNTVRVFGDGRPVGIVFDTGFYLNEQ